MKKTPQGNIILPESVTITDEQERALWSDPEFCRRLMEIVFAAEIPIQ